MKQHKFVLIDDDPATNVIGRIILKRVFKDCETLIFDQSEEGMNFLTKEVECMQRPTVVFLDLNMPRLSGFDILNQLNENPFCCPDIFQIYVLSSSIDDRDRDKASSYYFVKDYIEKPLTIDKLIALGIVNTS